MKDELIQKYIKQAESAIENAKNSVDTKLPESVFQLAGMSRRENRILLNELVKEGDKYLEIGIHKGSTFIPAMYNNGATGIAIDNFSQFGSENEVKTWFDQACRDHNITNFNFINQDCFNLTEDQKALVLNSNIYFYDGNHLAEDQEKALTYYFNLLTDPFIFIVDDWNHGPAKEGTKKGIELTKAVIHKEWHLDSTTTDKSWHNGLYVAVLSKP